MPMLINAYMFTSTIQVSYTGLLLHGDGTNGSTTILNSASNKTFAVSGSVSLSTSSFKFGTASINLATGYVTIPPLPFTYFPGSGNFSIDGWFATSADTTTGSFSSRILAPAVSSNTAGGFQLVISSNKMNHLNETGTAAVVIDPLKMSFGIWYHYGLQRNDTYEVLTRDGLVVAGAYNSTDFYLGATEGFRLGVRGDINGYYVGRIDELKIARNASLPINLAFKPPTSQFTTDSNTVALLHLDETSGTSTVDSAGTTDANYSNLVLYLTGEDVGDPYTYLNDYSPTRKILTRAPACDIFTDASDKVFGAGCISWPGTVNSYMTTAANAAYNIAATGSWCIDFWYKSSANVSSASYYPRLIGPASSINPGGTTSFSIQVSGGTNNGSPGANRIQLCDATGNVIITSAAINDGSWHYVLINYNNTAAQMFVDGTSVGTATVSAGCSLFSTEGIRFGSAPTATLASSYLNAKITDFRFGTGFTRSGAVPTARGASSAAQAPTSNIALTANTPMFGTSCLNANTTYITAPEKVGYQPQGDFTIECWVYPTAVGSAGVIANKASGTGNFAWQFWMDTSPKLGFRAMSPTGALVVSLQSQNVITPNAWYHLAAVCKNNVYQFFMNGVWQASMPWRGGLYGSIIDSLYANTLLVLNMESATVTDVSPTPASFSSTAMTYNANDYIVYGGSASYTGSSSYSTATASKFNMALPITIELAFKANLLSQTYHVIYDTRASAGGNLGVLIWVNASGAFRCWADGNNVNIDTSRDVYTANGTVQVGKWYQATIQITSSTCTMYLTPEGGTTISTSTMSISRTGGALSNTTLRLATTANAGADFFNGMIDKVRVTSGIRPVSASVTPFPTSTNTLGAAMVIGAYSTGTFPFTGKIDEFRISNTARYYAGMPAPTAAYPDSTQYNASQCVSLLNFEQRLHDFGIGNHVWLFNGSAAVNNTPRVYHGSNALQLNGSASWIQTTNASDFIFGTGDFTLEVWMYAINSGRNFVILDNYATSITGSYQLYMTSAGFIRWYSTTNMGTGTTNLLDAWHHVAVSRVSGTTKIFIDGIQELSFADTNTYGNRASLPTFAIGAQVTTRNTAYDFNGTIDSFKAYKGVGLYTTNFTPPGASAFTVNGVSDKDAHWNAVTCYLPLNASNGSSTFLDLSSYAQTVTASNVQGTNAQYYYVDRTCAKWTSGGYLSIPHLELFNTNLDFTIEMKVYLTTAGASRCLLRKGTGNTSGILIGVNSSLTPYMKLIESTSASTNTLTAASSLTTNTWYTLSFVRQGGNMAIYINRAWSASIGISTAQPPQNSTGAIILGYNADTPADAYDGYMSEFRWTSGFARFPTVSGMSYGVQRYPYSTSQG